MPRPGRLDKARAAQAAQFAAMSPEEKRLRLAKLQAGRIMKRVAYWPFPDGNRSLRTSFKRQALYAGRPKMTRAQALAAALAGAAAKRARTKLAREKRDAERMADILARRARGETLRAIGEVYDITATHVLRLIEAHTAPRRPSRQLAPWRR